jgi:hypothetical protein
VEHGGDELVPKVPDPKGELLVTILPHLPVRSLPAGATRGSDTCTTPPADQVSCRHLMGSFGGGDPTVAPLPSPFACRCWSGASAPPHCALVRPRAHTHSGRELASCVALVLRVLWHKLR